MGGGGRSLRQRGLVWVSVVGGEEKRGVFGGNSRKAFLIDAGGAPLQFSVD